jgi:hypothetical protein
MTLTVVSGLEALTRADDGTLVIPEEREEWREWVSATKARNWLYDDPLLDWLDRFGEDKGFERDQEAEGFDPRTDFRPFIFGQGDAFEQGVLRLLAERTEVVTIGRSWEDSRSIDAAAATVEAMRDATPIIAQGVLRDPQHRTYGVADLLVRSDVLVELFPNDLSAEDAAIGAPALWLPNMHYRVIDIKLRVLDLRADGSIGRTADTLAYQAQVWVYNTALGRIQGYEPPASYLLGRNWKRRGERGSGCLDRLGRIDMDNTFDRYDGQSLSSLAQRAHAWIREVRRDGAEWEVLPVPTRPELYPHMGNEYDDPWHGAKAAIARDLAELTMLPGVSPPRRRAMHERGITRWTDSAVSATSLGLEGAAARMCDAVLEANRADEPMVLPVRLELEDDSWREAAPLELFVDFEAVSSLADDFSALPAENGLPLIFQIGCGRMEDGEWRFDQWTVDRLTEPDEVAIIDAWVARIKELCAERGIGLDEARLYHWSPAETSTLTTAYNAARKRHPENAWPLLPWFDLLDRVVKPAPLSVTGAFGYGLKDIARAMHAMGLIETGWGDGLTDGLGAMVAAWRVDEAVAESGGKLIDDPLMQEVADYNQVDCQVMAEILGWLRERKATR